MSNSQKYYQVTITDQAVIIYTFFGTSHVKVCVYVVTAVHPERVQVVAASEAREKIFGSGFFWAKMAHRLDFGIATAV